jgi:hypothetical protein
MAIAKGFAKQRTTIDQPLWTFPMHLKLLANMEVKLQGLLQVAFFTTSLLSYADNGFPAHPPQGYAPLPEPGEQTKVVQRALTAAGKAVICKLSCISLQECQEAMGGVGYMDEPDEPEFNISRLYRDTAANMTWEGTTNVLASEVVRHLLKGGNLAIFSEWLEIKAIATVQDDEMKASLSRAWSALKQILQKGRSDLAYALADGREIMFSLAWVVSGVLLAHDAQRDGDATAKEVAKRWVLDERGGVGEFVLPQVVQAVAAAGKQTAHDRDRTDWDCRIVWDEELPRDAALGYRRTPKHSGRPEQEVARL